MYACMCVSFISGSSAIKQQVDKKQATHLRPWLKICKRT